MEPVDSSRAAASHRTDAVPAPDSAADAASRFSAEISGDISRDLSGRAAGDDARWRKFAWLVLGLAALLFFARLGVRALWSSEFRWAEIAREMRLTSNYFWPTINGRLYYDKPLGTYWLVVASTWVTGGMNEAAARLPCAIAGMLAVALLISLGRRLYDLKTGVVAGFILATSFSFVFFSRHASADVETIAGELVALSLFLRHQRDQDGWWVVALWLVMALTSQMKGLLGFVLPLAVIGSYCALADGWAVLGRALLTGPLRQRLRWIVDRNRWFFNWKTPLAIVLAGAIYYVPFAISHLRTGSVSGLSMVYRENVQRYFEPFDHRGPIYLYTYVIFALMAPWSVLLPAALVEAHRSRPEDSTRVRSDRFTLVFFWATFVFYTLSGSRRSYYILPILPAAALFIARLLDRPFSEMSALARTLTKIGFGVIVCAIVLSTLAFIPPRLFLPGPYAQLPPVPSLGLFALFWLGSIGAIVYAMRNFRPDRIGAAIAAIAWLFMFYVFVFAMPAGDAYRSEKPFAAHVRALIDNDKPSLALFRNQGPVFYLGLPRPVPQYDKLPDLNAAVGNGSVRWLIVRRRDIALLKFKNEPMAAETLYPWDAKEHGLNTMVLLRVAPPASP
jgi:4-amino-4-deoxy-L-arabinose transferase-like glycosyltransferase